MPPTPVSLNPGTGITSSATSGTFTPTSVGTWCFAAVYTPATGSNYQGSDDNISGTADPAECLSVTAATPGLTTTILPPSDTSVGNAWGDTATVAGNSVGGPPRARSAGRCARRARPRPRAPAGPLSARTTRRLRAGTTRRSPCPTAQTPTVGTWCFNASYAATPDGNYTAVPQQTGTECFSVTPATSSSATTASPTSVVIGPTGTATDSVTVTGNATGGRPTAPSPSPCAAPCRARRCARSRHRGAADAGELDPRHGDHLGRHLGHLHADRGRHLVLRGRLHAGERVQLHGFERQHHGHGRPRRVLQRHRWPRAGSPRRSSRRAPPRSATPGATRPRRWATRPAGPPRARSAGRCARRAAPDTRAPAGPASARPAPRLPAGTTRSSPCPTPRPRRWAPTASTRPLRPRPVATTATWPSRPAPSASA